jgi:hypothetical protein
VARIVAIVGRSGVGKTTVRRELAFALGWSSMGIDDHRRDGGGWHSLCEMLDVTTWPTLIESVAFPASYMRALARHDARLLEVVCSESDRLERGGAPTDLAFSYYWKPRTLLSTSRLYEVEDLAAWCREGFPP